MTTRPLFTHTSGSSLIVGTLAAAAFVLSPLVASAAEMLVGTTNTNRLLMFSSDRPNRVKSIRLKGLQPNERLLGLDMRPANKKVYALGSTSQIYIIDFDQKIASPVGGPLTPALRGDFFGFDFNPQADRIRITSDANQNLRVNPDTGVVAGVDTDLSYAAGDSGFAQDPGVVGSAYTNNDTDPATPTTLYNIDATRDVLVTQDPPNAGTLTTVGATRVTTANSLVAGFDIAASDGKAYAILRSLDEDDGEHRPNLHTIDLATGAATFIGEVGGSGRVTSLATLGPAN
ncbi:MAG: DUF4394 domain-containing protein [Deltaproteobacteria bacterium]|nr:DUF4394 domain-containing protein [Deltaproteobacteria bacterium]